MLDWGTRYPVPRMSIKKKISIFLALLALFVFAASAWGFFQYSRERAADTAAFLAKTGSVPVASVRVPILVYHSVVPDRRGQTIKQKLFSVTPAQLDEQLTFLERNGYTSISFDELRADILAGTTTPVAKPVVISFDDGWENQYANAFPLLKKHHLTATFFVFTNPVGKDDRFFTWEQLKEMQAAGMHIGSHTLSHPKIETLAPEQLHKEVFESKATLEAHLGRPVTAFASPFGKTTPALEAALEQAGYTTSRTLLPGTQHGVADLYTLQAYDVRRTLFDFKWFLRYEP